MEHSFFKRISVVLNIIVICIILHVPYTANAQKSVISQAQIGIGKDFMAMLKDNGTVWTVGKNNLGQLGNGTNTDRVKPASIPSLQGDGTPQHFERMVPYGCGEVIMGASWGTKLPLKRSNHLYRFTFHSVK